MSAKTDQIIADDQRYLMHTYGRLPVALASGDGMTVTDVEGKTYLDFLAGIATISLGYGAPEVEAALTSQSHTLMHGSNLFFSAERNEAALLLVEALGWDDGRVFFTNSGAESNECALKLARKWALHHKPQAHTILTARGSFHGRTFATLTATGQPERARDFAPVLPGIAYTEFNDPQALARDLTPDICALLLEPIQGESGVWPASEEYLKAAQELCHERNILLMFDEVQTGIYRTGKPFAFQEYGITPDVVTSAKALGNGFPVGACIAHDRVADAFAPGDHGSTFGGSPLACAVVAAVLKAHRMRKSDAHAREVGAYACDRLKTVPGLSDVRGRGLMLGATLAQGGATLVGQKLLSAGFIVNTIADKHLRIIPPLICDKTHIDALINALYAIMSEHTTTKENQ